MYRGDVNDTAISKLFMLIDKILGTKKNAVKITFYRIFEMIERKVDKRLVITSNASTINEEIYFSEKIYCLIK